MPNSSRLLAGDMGSLLSVLLPTLPLFHRPWRHSTHRGPTGRARTGSRCSTWIASLQLVIEIVSEDSVDRDNTFKLEAYALIGFGECGICDPEGLTEAIPWHLFRLQGDSYRLLQPDPELSEARMPAYWSDVFGMFLRMLSETVLGIDDPDPLGHRLQVWDPDLAKWRDHATDERDALEQAWEQTAQVREELGEERGIEIGLWQGETTLLKTHIDAVRVLLRGKVPEHELAQIETDWRTAGRYRSLWRRLPMSRQARGVGTRCCSACDPTEAPAC